MLMISMLAGASAFFSFAGAPVCAAEPVIVPVSKTPDLSAVPKEGGKLPNVAPKSRDPAVLLPACKEAPRTKRKRRLSDYPMA